MPTNDFKPFAIGAGANVLPQAQWLALLALDQGFATGTATSAQLNKAWRQSSIMATALGALITGVTGQDALDDGTVATIEGNLLSAIGMAGYAIDSGIVNAYVVTLSPAPVAYYGGMKLTLLTGNASTSTSPTVNVNGLGAVPILEPQGYLLTTGAIPANTPVPMVYNSVAGRFEIQVRQRAKPAGEIFIHSGSTAPAGSLIVPQTATNVSRTAYAALFAAIGTTWGVGDGSTTFGLPWVPAGYTLLQANSNVGSSTVGANIAHTHTASDSGHTHPYIQSSGNAQNYIAGAGGSPVSNTFGATTGTGQANITVNSSGGAANNAAGTYMLLCVAY